ncbi:hypothetical protein LINGRAHAP2_LOCUS32302 [Linum grandiflorum]
MKVKSGRKKKKRQLIVKVLIAPFRALCKATDFYVKTLMDCQGSGGGAGYGMAVNCHAQMFTVTVPHSHSTASSVNPRKRRRDKDQDHETMTFQLIQQSKSSSEKRSYSFEIGKIGMIEEDKSCSFRKDDDDELSFLN